MNNKYNKRVYAGYYKRYDGKLIYVITIAKDELSGEILLFTLPILAEMTADILQSVKKTFVSL